MNIIGGLDRNFEGSVTIKGQLLDHKKEKMLDAYRRGTIGYIYQAYNLVSHLTVLENVLVALDMTTLNHSERLARANELLDQVGLSDQVKKHPNQLSGAEAAGGHRPGVGCGSAGYHRRRTHRSLGLGEHQRSVGTAEPNCPER